MRNTIFVHNNKIHLLSEISTFNYDKMKYESLEYYQAISKEDIYYIAEDFTRFHLKLTGYINCNMDYSAYKDEMTEDEIENFYQWCKWNKVKITKTADRIVES